MNMHNFTYIISLLLIFFGCNQNIDGCLDAQACNYDPDANVDDGSCEYGGLTGDWNIQIIVSMQPWNILDTIFDENNILGVSDSTLDDFDSMDLPEPPSPPANWVSGYFYHPEWDSIFGDKFTQDYKSSKISDIGKKELVWKKEGNNWKIIGESWKPI